MYYLEITAVPVLRDSNPITSPAAEMASRLGGQQETVELWFHRADGKTHCYLGLSNPLRIRQAVSILKAGGFLFHEVPPPPAASTSVLLHRSVIQRPVVRPGLPPEQMVLPIPVTTSVGRVDAVFRAFSDLEDGCGIAFFFRQAPTLPLQLVSYLNKLSPEEGSICHELLQQPRLYEAVGCVYGSGSDLLLLTSEVLCCFSGLKPLTIPDTQVGSGLFDQLAAQNTVVSPVKPLCSIYLEQELNVLTDITASAGIYGIMLNKDTIFGIPLPHTEQTGSSIRLGFAADGSPVTLPLKLLRQHMFIGGPPGSGKGNQFFSMAAQLHLKGVPILLIESAKEEMHHLRKVIPNLQVWQPKEGEFVLNPFSLEGDITCGEMRASLLQSLRLCFKLDGPLEELFADTLNRCFARNGYTDDSTATSPGVTPFGLSEFMEEYVQLLDEKEYSKRTSDDIKTAGMVRLNALFNQNRAVFDTIHSIPVPELLQGQNLLQLNCLPTVEAKQMFASLLLISISTWLRLRGTHCADHPVKLAIILDESHNLLQAVTDSQGKTFSFARDFANMLLELRSQGVAILLADQSSNNIPKEITDVCATKIFLGSSVSSGIEDNLQFVGSDEIALRHLYLLRPGEGVYVAPGMPAAAFFACPNVIDEFHLEQPYPKKNRYLERYPRLTLETYRECGCCPARGKCTRNDKVEARQNAALLYQQYGHMLGKLMDSKKTPEHDRQVSGMLTKIMGTLYTHTVPRRFCTMVQFVREFNREHPGLLSCQAVLKNSERLWDAMKNKT